MKIKWPTDIAEIQRNAQEHIAFTKARAELAKKKRPLVLPVDGRKTKHAKS